MLLPFTGWCLARFDQRYFSSAVNYRELLPEVVMNCQTWKQDGGIQIAFIQILFRSSNRTARPKYFIIIFGHFWKSLAVFPPNINHYNSYDYWKNIVKVIPSLLGKNYNIKNTTIKRLFRRKFETNLSTEPLPTLPDLGPSEVKLSSWWIIPCTPIITRCVASTKMSAFICFVYLFCCNPRECKLRGSFPLLNPSVNNR